MNYRTAINSSAADKPVGTNQLAKDIARGRKDPVFFGEHFLGLQFHSRQKIWLWTTTKTQIKAAYNLAKEENIPLPKLELLLEHDFLKNILAPGNRFGKTLVTSIKHVWYNFYKIGCSGPPEYVKDIRYATLNISPHSMQVDAAYRYIVDIFSDKFIYEWEGKKVRNICKIKSFLVDHKQIKREIVFANNSMIKGVPTGEDQASSLAGTQFFYISYDEAPQCYSEDTDVLTNNGWKKFSEVKIGEYVPSLNLTTGLVESSTVEKVINQPYSGEMIQFGGGRGQLTDVMVTPNHKMVVAKSKGANEYNNFDFELAGNLVGKHFKMNQSFLYTEGKNKKHFIIPAYSSNQYHRYERKLPIEDFLLFLGLYISEGCVWKTRLTISQTEKGKAFRMLPKLLDALGYSWSFNKKVGFNIFDKQLTEFIKKFIPGLAEEKRIPREILNLSPKLLKYLFDGLILGDGSRKKNHGTYGTTSRGLADDVMELCLKLNFIPSLNIQKGGTGGLINGRKIKGYLDFYRIQFRTNWQFPRINHHPKDISYATVKKIFYTGNVVCLALDKNHTLMVRRNGKIIWSGNSLHLRDELPAKIQSRLLDSGGPMDIIGTPEVDKPSHVYYQRIVKYGLKLKDGFFTMIGGIANNIFIGENEKNSILASIKQTDKEKYRQVAFGDFVSTGAKLFPNAAIEQLWENYQPIEMGMPGHKYIIGVDWGFSDTGDPSVFYVIDITELMNFLNKKPPVDGVHYRIAFKESVKGASPYAALARLKILQMDFNDADIIHDSSSMGGIIISKMLKEMRVRHLHDFSISRAPKDDMLFYLVLCLTEGRKISTDEDGKITELNKNFGKIRSFVIPELEEQLGNYRVDDKKLEQDEVMALGMAIWYCEKKIAKHQTKVFDINLLANNSKDVLKISGQREVATKELTITERYL